MNNRGVRAGVLLATLASSLLSPAMAWAAEAPAQPGTVRPDKQAVAQPGTTKTVTTGTTAEKDSEATKEPTEDKESTKDTKPAVAEKDSEQAGAPATKPATNVTPAVASSPATASQSTTKTPMQADKATVSETTTSVRDEVASPSVEVETPSVRTEHADEVAAYELATVIDQDGDVRQEVQDKHTPDAVRGDDSDLTLADVPDVDGDGPDPDPGTDPAAAPGITSVSTGASIDTAQGTGAISFESTLEQTVVNVSGQPVGDAPAAELSVTVAGQNVTVNNGGVETSFVAPVIPVEVTDAVNQAVESVVPADVLDSVNAAVNQANADFNQAVQDTLAQTPDGQNATDTPLGQVTTWFEAH
ncbi:hypothetical protein [Corynebacterium vitaeruminis]|uniref:Secreted protein n=1 Tax=Corynebacterium vitaeruminis DSM 20294 TaxID=1224164 RepID=W5XZC9_9CORY|nr:hypothetical protein [Corynebacterium vitaeruminis]AHI22049.1 hypothetical protein B843_03290 [Corynebacterium vitaeruminis DSM 20294]